MLFLGPKMAYCSNFHYSSGAFAVLNIISFGPNNNEKLSEDVLEGAESCR